MKILTCIIAKDGFALGEEVFEIAQQAVCTLFPVLDFEKDVDSESWLSPASKVFVHVASNEKDSVKPNLLIHCPSGAVGLKLGYSELEHGGVFCADRVRLDQLKHASGCFAFAKADQHGFDYLTDAVNSHPVYYTETSFYIIASTRSTVVHEIARQLNPNTDGSTEYDLLGCRDLASQGHFFGRRTGYANVQASSVHEHLRATPYGAEFTTWHNQSSRPISVGTDEYRRKVRQIAEALVNSMHPLKGTSLHLSITGGRDSRLLAAALSNVDGISIQTATSGTDSHPDVILGRKIAEVSGWPHKLTTPKVQGSVVLAEDPLARLVRNLDVHDCSTSAWDDAPDYGPYSASPTMSGVGGEILRGGMTLISRDYIDSQQAELVIRNTMCGGGFFTDSIQKQAHEYSRNLRNRAGFDPSGALDEYYFKHRNSRWVCNRRNGARTRWNVIDPLLDNRLILLARDINASDRWTERLVYDVLGELAPHLQGLPIEGARWRFDRDFAEGDQAAQGRFAMSANDTMNRFDWRRMQNPDVRTMIIEMVLDNFGFAAQEVFDRHKVEMYLQSGTYPTTIWHILTSVMFMSGQLRNVSRKPKAEILEIPVVNLP